MGATLAAVNFDDVRTQALAGRAVVPDALELTQHTLTLRSGPDAGRRIACEGPLVSIGSAAANDVALRDETVSQRHCEISLRGGRRILRDLGSTNGTLLDGVEILEAVLPDRARLTLGEAELEYEAGSRTVRIVPSSESRFGELFGTSETMRRTFALLARVAPTTLSCLVLGETGTGKDLAARSIHAASPRREGPFVVVDCAAIQRNLVESQLFGHERGAFTGADRQHRGSFEEASGGTLFLDEIGELPLDLQPRLLRVLERREVMRLGGAKPLEVDIRVVAATHRDLGEMVRSGTFREDLFYRLSEFTLRLPPLRERPEDVAILAETILRATFGDAAPKMTPQAIESLAKERWPGNVRELRNVLRRAAAFADRGTIDAAALQSAMVHAPVPAAAPGEGSSVELRADLALKDARDSWLEALETRYLAAILGRFGDDVESAAAHVGEHRKSYARLLRERGLKE